jgi:hypothetical protein
MSGVSDPSETHGRLIAASKVNGTTVYNTAGEKLGSVRTLKANWLKRNMSWLPPRRCLPNMGHG